MQQYKIAQNAKFITLTYDTDYVPITKHGFMSLSTRSRKKGDDNSKGHLQLFFKRLRKLHGNNSNIKYYAVGEYGGRTMRPHYHIILFNAKIELIQDAWKMGHVHYGDVNEASVGYTLKYISKASKVPLHRNDDRVKEYSLMSKDLASII